MEGTEDSSQTRADLATHTDVVAVAAAKLGHLLVREVRVSCHDVLALGLPLQQTSR